MLLIPLLYRHYTSDLLNFSLPLWSFRICKHRISWAPVNTESLAIMVAFGIWSEKLSQGIKISWQSVMQFFFCFDFLKKMTQIIRFWNDECSFSKLYFKHISQNIIYRLMTFSTTSPLSMREGVFNIALFLTRYWKAFVYYRRVGFDTQYFMN